MVKLTPPAIKSHICHHSKSLTATVYLIPSTLSQKSHRSRLTRCEYLRNLSYIRMEVCTLRSARVDPIGFFIVIIILFYFFSFFLSRHLCDSIEWTPWTSVRRVQEVWHCGRVFLWNVGKYVCVYVSRVSLQNIFSLRLSTSTRTRQWKVVINEEWPNHRPRHKTVTCGNILKGCLL